MKKNKMVLGDEEIEFLLKEFGYEYKEELIYNIPEDIQYFLFLAQLDRTTLEIIARILMELTGVELNSIKDLAKYFSKHISIKRLQEIGIVIKSEAREGYEE